MPLLKMSSMNALNYLLYLALLKTVVFPKDQFVLKQDKSLNVDVIFVMLEMLKRK